MAEYEAVEKIRQAIMRYRELLDVYQSRLDAGNLAYQRIINQHGPGDVSGMKEKDVQWLVAEKIVGDTDVLNRAVLQMQFEAREMERAFEELYGILVEA
jgi:hypothetical protein